MKKNLIFLCLIQFVTLVGLTAAQKTKTDARWTPELMMSLKRIGSPAVSPDGKLVAYTVTTAEMEGEKSEMLTYIWVLSTDGKKNHQFTFGEKSCTNPAFSPDGQFLAFASNRSSDGKNQLWVMRVSGSEAEQITAAKAGVISFRWSQDSKRLAFTMKDAESDQESKNKKEKIDMWVVDKNQKFTRLYCILLDKGPDGKRKTRQLTSGSLHITNFNWSPDSKLIVFAHQLDPAFDNWAQTDISVVSADSGAVQLLVARKGYDGDPIYSPDGQWIAFESDGEESHWARAQDIYLMPSTGGTPRKLAETPDRNSDILGWSKDGLAIYVQEVDQTSSRILSLPIQGSSPTVITNGDGTCTMAALSKNAEFMAFIHQRTEQPPDLYLTSLSSYAPIQLTNTKEEQLDLPLSRTEVIRWKSKDGREIEGLLTYPARFQAGKRAPLILNIHGGPTGVFTQTYTASGAIYPLQAFAEEGYAILRPNPRGSSGYGKEFRFANYNDWGFGDFEDDIAGVDKVIEMGVAHKDSLVVCGWSYGGFMTSFIITRTDRFKAACVGAGVTNLISFNGTSDIAGFLPDYFYGEFWNRLDAYIRHSAVYHVQKVQTPTLVLHGESDVRVPLSQGQELYVALKRAGVETEMVVYPRMPHGFSEPKFIVDTGKRMIDWFNVHLKRKQFEK